MRLTEKLERPARGFTLIELMVVMLLISIVMAVVIPRFDSGLFQDPIKKLNRWMINTVRVQRAAAIRKQKVQGLVIDLGNNRMWLVDEDMSEEAMASAADKASPLPGDLRVVDVQYPLQDRISSGITEVKFYPAGYSDQALIHIENNNADRFTFLVEPLLPKVKFFEEWIDF